MRWTDIQQIAAQLAAKHPHRKPLSVEFPEVRDLVIGLEGFSDDPARYNVRILESIQLAWSDRCDGGDTSNGSGRKG
ncbi:Fe-S cluster assembly protein IscX [Streptomyces roseoverticillatus]|uniref:Fe-S cluster assembly protein IscX n=1 Tax=Streptomyces roseoverticillatus TaxID=66429 RepID=UPI000694D1FB|nr:Fe-S cluster assembly protein IscX [Streptomyces roseoverticillatus]